MVKENIKKQEEKNWKYYNLYVDLINSATLKVNYKLCAIEW